MANIYKNAKADLTANTATTVYTVLQESEILKATAATANRLHIVVSVLEINRS